MVEVGVAQPDWGSILACYSREDLETMITIVSKYEAHPA